MVKHPLRPPPWVYHWVWLHLYVSTCIVCMSQYVASGVMVHKTISLWKASSQNTTVEITFICNSWFPHFTGWFYGQLHATHYLHRPQTLAKSSKLKPPWSEPRITSSIRRWCRYFWKNRLLIRNRKRHITDKNGKFQGVKRLWKLPNLAYSFTYHHSYPKHISIALKMF